jgi:hypothetical protein
VGLAAQLVVSVDLDNIPATRLILHSKIVRVDCSLEDCGTGYRQMSKREHEFSVALVQTVRSTYKRGFLSTLKGKNKEQQRVLKQQRDMYEGKLETARESACIAEERAQADINRAHSEAALFRERVRTKKKLLSKARTAWGGTCASCRVHLQG